MGTAAIVLASPKKTMEDASGKAPGAAKPLPFTDPTKFYEQLDAQTKNLQNLKGNREAENDARVASWKKAAKYIPVVGEYAGYFLDLANWLGKKFGSNYAEQNSPEDLQAAADWIANYLLRGFVPPAPRFTEKDGANYYAAGLIKYLQGIDAAPENVRKAVNAMGTLTIANSAHPSMIRAVQDASGPGSLVPGGSLYIVAGIISALYGVPYVDAVDFTRPIYVRSHVDTSTPETLIQGHLAITADMFVQAMTAGSAHHIATTKIAIQSKKHVTVGDCGCNRPPMPRTKEDGFFG